MWHPQCVSRQAGAAGGGSLGCLLYTSPWVDLQEIWPGAPVDRNALAASVIGSLIEAFSRFQDEGFAGFAEEWVRFDQVRGQGVRLHLPNGVVAGIARGVDVTGALLLETPDGRTTPYLGGEISLRLAS